mgnify:FL=1
MKIVILLGSIRKLSYNRALACHMIDRYSDRLDKKNQWIVYLKI